MTQDGNDTQVLAPMLEKAQAIVEAENLTGLADLGYYNGTQLKACEDQNISVYVAIPDKSKKIARQQRFTRQQFQYDKEQDCYHCPQGQPLNRCGKPRRVNDKTYIRYKSKRLVCNQCPVREHCLTQKAKFRQIERWQHETVIERHQERMKAKPQAMRQRSALVELK